MTTKTDSILMVITKLIRMSRKNYCYPSQVKILELIKTYHGLKFSRRHLNRLLKTLENQGYIKRLRRISKGRDGKPRFASTIYFIKTKVFAMYKKTAVFLKSIGFVIKEGFQEQNKKARAAAQALNTSERPLTIEENLAFLKKAIKANN